MTIATDRTGENIAFGATTPLITPRHTPQEILDFCDTVASKLAARQGDLREEAKDESLDSFTIPLPIQYATTDTMFDIQDTALSAIRQMSRSLFNHGYTVLNCTPAAMSDSPDDAKGCTVGYVLVATQTSNVSEMLAAQGENPVAVLWTEYTRLVYGRAAIDQAMNEMQSLMAGMSGNIH